MCKSFYGLPEQPDHFVLPPSYKIWCTTPLHKREKYYNIENINWLNNTQKKTIIQQNLTKRLT